MTPVAPELADRFTRDWHALTGPRCADRALVALSGGPDSTALLLLMQATLPSTVAATVDHALRAASSAEAGAAADLCRAVGVGHTILQGALPGRVARTANLSARARALRYALLDAHADAVGARWIVTAHHADDQLETLVMRVNRGAGVRGLSGIRRQDSRQTERIVRPLLGWRRGELAAVVRAAGVVVVNDPSNVDDRFDRARLRRHLADADWLDPVMAARSVAALQDADDAIEWAADLVEAKQVMLGNGQAILRPSGLPAEIRRRLVERCLRAVDPAIALRGGAVTRLVGRLDRDEAATLGGVAVDLAILRNGGVPVTGWVFRPAPPRRAV